MKEILWMARTDHETGCRQVTGKQERVLAFVKRNQGHIVEYRRVPK